MAQIRTRKEKEKAQQLRLRDVAKESKTATVASYSFASEGLSKNTVTADTLLKVDSRYIVKDLLKTVTISSILLCIVIGIYFYLRYN